MKKVLKVTSWALTAGLTCYAELAVSLPSVVVTIAIAHFFAYPRRNGQAGLAWVAWLNTKTLYPRTQ